MWVSDIFGSDSSDDENQNESMQSTPIQVLLDSRPKDCGVLRSVCETQLFIYFQHITLNLSTITISFHKGTEEALLLHVERMAIQGDAQSVLDAIDLFCYSRHWFELDRN